MEHPLMKIVIDRNIPFIAAPLSRIGEVISLSGDKITSAEVRDADILVTRTRTRCDAALLDGSRCTLIATATIGTDHIDLDYCRSHDITTANAPGCNAPAVAQWVLAAIRAILPPGKTLSGRTLGVIGAGNVGSLLIRWAKGLGMEILVNDPPLQESGCTSYRFCTLDEIARNADIITVHTPLTTEGPHPTRHLVDSRFVSALRRKPILLNAARGAVTETSALIDGLRANLISDVGIDCWEGEPTIDPTLLSMARVATPHIAGYSREGKIRATQMVLDAISRHLRLDTPLIADAGPLHPVPDTITEQSIGYDIIADTRILRSDPSSFEHHRNTYPLRPEPKVTQ